MEAYNPATQSWVELPNMPTARGELSTSVVNGTIYAIGGATSGRMAVPTVEAFAPGEDPTSVRAAGWGMVKGRRRE